MNQRFRRPLVAILTTGLLALAGLVTMPVAHAAPGQFVTPSISPTSVVFGSTTVFEVTLAGGTSTGNNTASRFEVDVPAGFSTFNVVGSTAPTGWTQTLTNRTIVFAAGNASGGLTSSQEITVDVSATASSTGSHTWTTRAYKGKENTSQALTVETSPVVTVTGGSQTITFAPLGDRTFGDAPFTVSATGGPSGNPVTFTSAGDCTSGGTNGATITLTGAGSCTVTANQAAGNGYTAAAPVARTFSIAKAAQTISFPGIASQTYGGPDVTLAATASSGLPVSYAVLSGPCAVSGSTLSYSGAGTCEVQASQAGNANYLAATSVTNTVTITKATATMSLSGLSHTYDASGKAATVTTDPAGLTGVEISYTRDGNPVGSPTDAGTYDVTATLTNPNYSAESVQGSLTIAPKDISGTFTVEDKVYDGTTSASVLTRGLLGAESGDDVHLSGGTATFDSKDAGTRTATLSGAALTGDDAANYTLSGVADATAEISPLQVTGTFAASDKTYDGNTVAQGTAGLVGTVGGDDVAASYTAAFADEDAGTWSVTATLTLTGADAGNYTLASSSVTDPEATIWVKELTASFTAHDKVYDSTTAATVSGTNLGGVVDGDTVQLDVTGASFDTEDVGTDKTVTAGLALSGADAANYSVPATGTTTADITPRGITATFTADDKVYDGTTAATGTGTPNGILTGDTVGAQVDSASFASEDVGTWTVTATLSLTGGDAGNYALTTSELTDEADITAKALTPSFTAASKVYDGTRAATVSDPQLDGVVDGDTVSLDVTNALFGTKDVGTGKTVTADLALSGADAGNYSVPSTGTATADITQRGIDATFTATDKTYDGTTDATGTAGSAGILPVDSGTAGVQVDSASFSDKNVGTWVVTAQLSMSGADGGNYSLNSSQATDEAQITARSVTGSFTASDKVYDGTRTATVSGTALPGKVAGDEVTLVVGEALFDNRNVGTGKTVTGTGLSLTGAAAGNYSLTSTSATTTASITQKTVVGAFTAADKVWDGTTGATISGRTLTGTVTGDDVTLAGGSATFDTAAVGTGKTVTGSGFALVGADAGNYHLTPAQPWTTTASITPRWSLTGFYQPVDMRGVVNTIKAGQAVPLKFEVFTTGTPSTEVTDVAVFGPGALNVKQTNCTGTTINDAVEVTNTGSTSLRYDTTGGQFIQNWKTPSTVGVCYEVSVRTLDGTTIGPAIFKTVK